MKLAISSPLFSGLMICAASLAPWNVDAKSGRNPAADPFCTDCPVKEERFSKIENFAASTDAISTPQQSATSDPYCPKPDEYFLKQARNAYAQSFPGSSANTLRRVAGVQLSGPKEQLALAVDLLGSRPPSTWSKKAQECAPEMNVVCALGKIYGSEESALRALTVAKRTGYFISVSQEENPTKDSNGSPILVEQIWNPSEVRMIDDVTAYMPSNFARLPTMKPFLRVADGYVDKESPDSAGLARSGYPSSTGYVPGKIVLFQTAFDADPRRTRSYIAHELGHHYDFANKAKNKYGSSNTKYTRETINWDELSGWQAEDVTEWKNGEEVTKKRWTHAPDAGFVRAYAATSPLEDFAESIAYYLYYPKDLKAKTQVKFDRLKEQVFSGVEYNPDSWPKFEPIKRRLAKPETLISTCLKQLSNIHEERATAAPASSEIYLWSRNNGSFTGIPVTEFARSSCLDDTIAKAASEVAAADPDYCAKGKQGVDKALRADFGYYIKPLLTLAIEYRQAKDRNELLPCRDGEPFDAQCFTDVYLNSRQAEFPQLQDIPEPELEKIGKQLFDLINAKAAWAGG